MFISFVEPSLWIGTTLAVLVFSGNILSLNEVLHMSLKVKEMRPLAHFNILIGIDEGPDVLKSSNEEMISLISFGVVGYNNKEWGILGGRLTFGFLSIFDFGICLLRLGPTSVKNLLKEFAISFLLFIFLALCNSSDIRKSFFLFMFNIFFIPFHKFFIIFILS